MTEPSSNEPTGGSAEAPEALPLVDDAQFDPEPTTASPDGIVPPRIDRRRLRIFGPIIAVALIVGGFFALQALKPTPFEDALESCDIPDLVLIPELGASIMDDGKTLIINHKGEEDIAGLDIDQLVCVLNELEVPAYISSQMDKTRAMDGKQTAEWGKFKVMWSYHPNSGLDTIFTR